MHGTGRVLQREEESNGGREVARLEGGREEERRKAGRKREGARK